jgi:hypothetical protein
LKAVQAQGEGISANEVPDYLARETRDDVGAATPRGLPAGPKTVISAGA